MTESEFLHLALHSYSNKQCCTVDEFNSDLGRINLIRKCIRAYQNGDEINHRLVLNHCIILFNIFGENAFKLLMYKVEDSLKGDLLPYLNQINRLPLPIDMMGIQYNQEIKNYLDTI